MLHKDSGSSAKSDDGTAATNPQPQSGEAKAEINSLVASSQANSLTQVLLATAWVTVNVPSGRSVTVRALLDQGSEMTFVNENLAQVLRVKRLRMPISISAVGCVNAGTYRHAAKIIISPRDKSTPAFTTTALILKSLTSYTPKRTSLENSFTHLSNLSWADHDPMSSDSIDLIIGADLYSEIILDGIRKGPARKPFAQNFVLDGSSQDPSIALVSHYMYPQPNLISILL